MGWSPPMVLVSFFSSMTITSLLVAESTIFSRRRAAPPPLTMSSVLHCTWSAPSKAMSSSVFSSRWEVLRPNRLAAISIWYDVGTKVTSSLSLRIFSVASSRALRTVDPLPKPMVVPFLISLRDCAAALSRAFSTQDIGVLSAFRLYLFEAFHGLEDFFPDGFQPFLCLVLRLLPG